MFFCRCRAYEDIGGERVWRLGIVLQGSQLVLISFRMRRLYRKHGARDKGGGGGSFFEVKSGVVLAK